MRATETTPLTPLVRYGKPGVRRLLMHVEDLHARLELGTMPLVDFFDFNGRVATVVRERDWVGIIALCGQRLVCEPTTGKFSGHGSIFLLH